MIGTMKRLNRSQIGVLEVARTADRLSRLCRFNANPQPSQGPKIEQVFSNQALNPLANYGVYSFAGLEYYTARLSYFPLPDDVRIIETTPADNAVTPSPTSRIGAFLKGPF
jgi:hypothetical protein